MTVFLVSVFIHIFIARNLRFQLFIVHPQTADFTINLLNALSLLNISWMGNNSYWRSRLLRRNRQTGRRGLSSIRINLPDIFLWLLMSLFMAKKPPNIFHTHTQTHTRIHIPYKLWNLVIKVSWNMQKVDDGLLEAKKSGFIGWFRHYVIILHRAIHNVHDRKLQLFLKLQ